MNETLRVLSGPAHRDGFGGRSRGIPTPASSRDEGPTIMQRSDQIQQALEEAVRHLESAKTDLTRLDDLDFEDARVAGFVSTALSAARAALTVAKQRDNLVEDSPTNP